MASLNKVILIGNLGRDPEVRNLPNGDACANVSIACTEKWKDKSGEKQERTEWVRLVFWRRLAEIVGEYLHKGDSIYVEGKMQTRQYEKDGVTHYATEVVCDEMKMLSTRRDSDRPQPDRAESAPRQATTKPAADFDDDVPF